MALTHLADTGVLTRIGTPQVRAEIERHAAGRELTRADFDRIAAVTGQGVEWVVPAGSVD